MRRRLLILITMAGLGLAGCHGLRHAIVRPIPPAQMPQLQPRPTPKPSDPPRPKFGPGHESLLLDPVCFKQVEFLDGWCESTDVAGEYRCYQIRIRAPKSCVVVDAQPAPPPAAR